MGALRPETLNPLTIGVTQAVTLTGMLYASGMVATGLSMVPTVGLGMGLFATSLGSGLLLGGISLAGFLCARTAAKIRTINNEQLAVLREAEKTGIMPDGNPYRLLDAGMERSPFTIATARIGGVIAGVIGAVTLVGAAMAGSSAAALPLLGTGVAALAIGMATHRASRVAEDALAYAEQKTRDASQAMRSATPAVEWAKEPLALTGTEYTYPPAGHYVNKYMEEQAVREVALLEDLRGR